jgi:hypothetical protein
MKCKCGGELSEQGHDDGIQGTYYCNTCGTCYSYDLNGETWSRPTLHSIQIYKDGNMWCALVGGNIQSGWCGFGVTPQEAIEELMEQFKTQEQD